MLAPLAPAHVRPEIENRYPLSALQEGMVYQQLRAPGSGIDIEQVVFFFTSAPDPQRLRRAWDEASNRYDVLRAAIECDEIPPQHAVLGYAPVPFAVDDPPALAPAERKAYVEACLQEERTAGFDLASAPLQRLRLIRFAGDDQVLIWSNHHIVLDGRARSIVLRDVFDNYCGRTPQPAGPSYADHIAWLAARDTATAERFWREYLAGISAPTPLPVATGARSSSAGARTFVARRSYDEGASAAIAALARANGTTVNVVLQAAWALLLSRHAGTAEAVFGGVRACRRSARAGSPGTVGLLINTLPVRVTVDENARLADLLRQTHRRWNALRDVEHTPLRSVAAWSAIPKARPLFDSIVVYDRESLEAQVRRLDPSDTLGIKRVRVFDQTGAAITLAVAGTQRLEFRLAVDSERYAAADAEALMDQLSAVLRDFPLHAGGFVRDVSLLTGNERRRVLAFNRSREYARDATIHALFAEQAAQRPDAVAAQLGDTTMTYARLAERSDAVACELQRLGVGRGDYVGVCVERSFDMLAALIGVLKAGAASIALDPTHPPSRTTYMLERAAVTVVLAQADLIGALTPALERFDAARVRVVVLERIRETAGEHPRDAGVTARDAAHVMYTSGSTGAPKGAVLPHRAVVRTVRGSDYLEFSAGETFFAFVPLTFDVAVLEIWGPLLCGARLVLCPPGLPSLDLLGATIRSQGVTTLWLTTALFEQMVDEALPQLAGVRQLIVGGDVMSPSHARRVLAAHPRLRLLNVYGPTEATVLITAHRVDVPPAGPIPLGAPIVNAPVYILDAQRRPVPVGVPGEIYTGGDGLALGYLNEPERTAERFVADPFAGSPEALMYRSGDLGRWRADGAVEFLGRIDTQVKVRGLRVELGEIESTLTDHPSIREAVVVALDGSVSEKQLVAYIVPRGAAAPSPDAVQRFLATRLPVQAIPAYVVPIDRLPRTATGKFDRKALPRFSARDVLSWSTVERNADVPASAAEITVAAYVAETLGLADIGLDDDFFAFGGDSLRAMRLISHLRAVFCVDLRIPDFVADPTVRGLSAQLALLERRAAHTRRPARIHALRAQGTAAPVFFLHGDLAGGGHYCQEVARSVDARHPFYVIDPHGSHGEPLPDSIEAIARENVAEIRALAPGGPVILGGFCNGGIVAYEMARQLAAAGIPVEHVTIIDAISSNVGITPAVSARRRLRYTLNRVCAAYGSHSGERCCASWTDWHDDLVARWRMPLERYIPGRYAGSISLLWTEECAAEARTATEKWRVVAPRVSSDRVPGSHLTSISRHLRQTSGVLARHLTR